jgi:predicted AlkP superfamily phosphohydrolase/phosphomutase/tetratricopeptide (TPR) repeat protein
MTKAKKLLLIGWDAADWQIIEPLIKEGKMPALKSLMEKGCSGNIATLNPPLSPMLWTSIATGKRAYDHGIHGFAEYNAQTEEIEPVKATSRKVKTFWNILNEAGLKTNIINWWPSHPAEKINGVCVSNFFHAGAPTFGEEWRLDESCIFPLEFFEELKKLRLHPAELTLAHVIPFIPEAEKLDPENDAVLKPLLKVLAHCSSIHNAVTHLMENTEWDVTAVYYEAIDHFSHLAMKYHPPQQEGIDDKDYHLYKGIVEAAYRFHDMMLDRLIQLAGDDCNLMLVSDHGFESGDLRIVNLPDTPASPALEHRKYGVFLATGPDFLINQKVYGNSLLDIAPSILHLFDLPIGDDMEGRVIPGLWKNDSSIGRIPSWELMAPTPGFVGGNHTHMSNELLNQLQDLGYIHLPDNEKQAQVEKELEYNLIQSLLDGNQFERAKSQAESYHSKYKDTRSQEILANIYLQMGAYDSLEGFVEQVDKECLNPGLQFIRSLKDLYTGEFERAIQNFKSLESNGVNSVQLYNQLGQALFLSGFYKEAIQYYEKSLNMNILNAFALTGKAQCLVELICYEEAVPLLEQSLELTFFQPNAHYLMALCLQSMKYEKEAVNALQLALSQAPKHLKAKRLLQEINGNTTEQNQEITIVSGLPRSGTSMMMQLLEAAGIEALTDEIRTSDSNNPKGYFEYEKVKQIGRDTSWVPEARGKVVKVVSPLLRYLPSEENYKIVCVKRPLTEVIVSQEVMKGKDKREVMKYFPFQLAMELQQEEERLGNWLKAQSNMEHIEIEYYDCLNNPDQVIKAIGDFLNITIDKESIKAIDSSLHRNKLGE